MNLQIKRLVAKAQTIFPSEEKAIDWFHTRCLMLGNITPMECCETDFGLKAVSNLLDDAIKGVG